MVTKRQTGAAPLIPRRASGKCGTCSGHIYHDNDLEADVCRQCNRQAGPAPLPPPPTPEEIRQGVLTELANSFDDSDPSIFWARFVLVADLARILLTERKSLLGWCYTNKFKPTPRRHPDTGRRVLFLTVEQARSIIEARR